MTNLCFSMLVCTWEGRVLPGTLIIIFELQCRLLEEVTNLGYSMLLCAREVRVLSETLIIIF